MRIMMIVVSAAALLAVRGYAASPDIMEGLWEITVKMEITGMPAGVPAQIVQQCLTKKDIEDPRTMTPSAGPDDGRCQFSDYQVQGNTATWNWTCKGEAAMTGSGSIIFSGASYKGTNRISMKHTGPVKNITRHYTGKRLGDCKNN